MGKKKEKQDDWDDGRVIAPMNGDELPAYRRTEGASRRTAQKAPNDITKKERRGMVRAMFAVMLPKLLIVLLGFGITVVLMVLWLS